MFRQGLRRCAIQTRSTASAALASQQRTVLPIFRPRTVALSASVNQLKAFTLIQRLYSSEATVQAENAPAPNELPLFKDLVHHGVHHNLVEAITHGMKYDTMTDVQAKTIKPALKGTDIVAQAKTGTGKTLSFLLPMLQRMIEEDPSLANRNVRHRARSDDVRGIVLSPTRELAEQIAVEAERLTRNTGLKVQCAVGGTEKRSMLHKTRREGCHLLVATPGRLNDLLQDERSGIDAPNLAALVLDEADRMLDVGFERELHEIMSSLPKPEEKVRQTILVSATIPDDVIRLARTMVRPQDFEFVQTIPENESLTHDKVPQHIVPISSWTNMFPSLFELMDREASKAQEDPNLRPFKAIVYFNTTALVELAGELAHQRQRDRLGPVSIHPYMMQSKLSQVQRTRTAERFRKAKSGVLFSSDVTARGMDFPDVTHVIQVDVPRDRESYIHRLGRTGRQNKEGEGWLLIPHLSIRDARKILKGLPIKQNSSLNNAEVLIESEDLPPAYQEMRGLFQLLPRKVLGTTYTSMFGPAGDKQTLAEDLNNWTRYGWGWQTPPAVSPKWAKQIGVDRVRSMNITEEYDRGNRDDRNDGNDRGDRFGNRSGDRFGDRRSSRYSQGRSQGRSEDPFDHMKRNARHDSFRSRRGSRNASSF